jgi:HAAS domain-containing protein
MTTDTLHPLAAEYLKRLQRAARRLPPDRRAELVAEIESHLAEALDPMAPEPEARNVLERLGAPEAIVAAEQPGTAKPVTARGTKEMVAILLLLFGGFIAGVGWLVGVILLWGSSAWITREKWIGTLVVPGGLALPFFILSMTSLSSESCVRTGNGHQHCTTDGGGHITWIVISAILVLAPIASAMYLANRARRAP